MCVEAGPVLGAESVDFLLNSCDLKIWSEDHIRHVPRCLPNCPVFERAKTLSCLACLLDIRTKSCEI
jgi:hypothetical protein